MAVRCVFTNLHALWLEAFESADDEVSEHHLSTYGMRRQAYLEARRVPHYALPIASDARDLRIPTTVINQ